MFTRTIEIVVSAVAFATVLSFAGANGAHAESVMKACGAQWKAAKAANTTGGKTWPEFLAECRTQQPGAAAAPTAPAPAPAAAAAPAPAPAPAATTSLAPKPKPMATATTGTATATGGTEGEHSRIHECSTQYRAAKAANTLNGVKWPQFWHNCDVQLKAEGK
jgi:hypothetical protein